MNRRTALCLVLALTPGAALAQSLTTTFSGTVQSIGNGAGTFFDVTALHEQGIIVTGFDVHLGASAGTAVPVHFYYRPGSYQGFEQNIAQWRYLGHTIATSAGVGLPTAVPSLGAGVHIRQNETIGFRFGNGSSNQRYNTELTTAPEYANDDVRINLGAAQNTSFFNSIFSPRGWNGTIYYTIGATVPEGACCLPDRTCIQGRPEVCAIAGGFYQGDETICATVFCLEPQPGACCLPGGSCIVELVDTCLLMGGVFNGEGTACDASACGIIDAFGTTITITTGQYAGNFFNISAIGGVDIEILAWDLNLSSSAGANNSIRVYYRTGPWEGHHNDPSAWTLVDEIPVIAAGPGNPTRVTMRGPIIPAGETYGFRIGPSVGALRYTSDFPASIATDTAELIRGAAQGVLFGSSLIVDRGWQGVVHYRAVGSAQCYANCDGSTIEPILNVDDFTCFINEFASAQALPHEQQISHYANCDSSTVAPVLNVDDFTCFINAFAQGCP